MAVDLLCKVAIAAIQLDRADLVEDIVKTICSHNASDTGKLSECMKYCSFIVLDRLRS